MAKKVKASDFIKCEYCGTIIKEKNKYKHKCYIEAEMHDVEDQWKEMMEMTDESGSNRNEGGNEIDGDEDIGD